MNSFFTVVVGCRPRFLAAPAELRLCRKGDFHFRFSALLPLRDERREDFLLPLRPALRPAFLPLRPAFLPLPERFLPLPPLRDFFPALRAFLPPAFLLKRRLGGDFLLLLRRLDEPDWRLAAAFLFALRAARSWLRCFSLARDSRSSASA